MLETLYRAEKALPALLENASQWHSLFVDYHPPIVERLWCQWEAYRLYLHRIHPCAPREALFHPHGWPSAMRVWGTYEMGIGYSEGNTEPPILATVLLRPGSAYEMIDPHCWHYARPTEGPSMSLMVTGTPWKRWSPSPQKALGALSEGRQATLLAYFRSRYP